MRRWFFFCLNIIIFLERNWAILLVLLLNFRRINLVRNWHFSNSAEIKIVFISKEWLLSCHKRWRLYIFRNFAFWKTIFILVFIVLSFNLFILKFRPHYFMISLLTNIFLKFMTFSKVITKILNLSEVNGYFSIDQKFFRTWFLFPFDPLCSSELVSFISFLRVRHFLINNLVTN